VVHEQAARPVEPELAQGPHLGGRTGRDVPGVHVGGTNPAEHVAILERGVRDRVARRRGRENLMDAEVAPTEGTDTRDATAPRTALADRDLSAGVAHLARFISWR
jgi:hypothetical protein